VSVVALQLFAEVSGENYFTLFSNHSSKRSDVIHMVCVSKRSMWKKIDLHLLFKLLAKT